ncbi:FG-GAP repeat protein [Engelhardtia mirabilis]|uniref:Uncharacterized protein n=1 Tax=Engelhardtia mirabilis TaxID=2528011 RepID=A0A518BSB9_9BACT|nr:hypothetical protein Pla133_49870 [Planctomycetes bacterium Pla133]QDV04190.1 hypothetical protein Pla86_49850 [Planctomycetes bacterium Pla86]
MSFDPTSALVTSLVLLGPATAQVAVPTGTITASTSTTGDKFGESVAIDGDVLVVGARAYSQIATTAGTATIFERQPDGSWLEAVTLLPPTPTLLGFFGDAVAVEGDTVFVAETADDTFAVDQGAVHVYRRQSNGSWPLVQVLGPPGPTSFASFGDSLSVDSGRLAVGNFGVSSTSPKEVVIFARQQDGTWAVEAEVLPPAPTAQWFACSVAIVGDWLVVGAADDTGTQTPTAFVYRRRSDGSWPLHSTLHPLDLTGDQNFGIRVEALEVGGDLLVAVGATDVAAVDVFEVTAAGGPTHLDRIVGPPAEVGTFGYSIVLEAQRLIVGDPNHSYGRVYVYERATPNRWELSTVLDHGKGNPGEIRYFGWDLAKDAETLFVGEPGYGGPLATQSGEIRTFDSDSLFQSAGSISVAAGGSVDLLLAAGSAEAGHLHLVLGSASGRSPGVPLGGGLVLPLVADAYTSLTLAGGGGLLAGGFGQLDSLGTATATLTLPTASDPALAGLTVTHAFVTIDAGGAIADVGGPSTIELVP